MKSGCEGAAMEEGDCGGGLALMRLGACVCIQGGKVLRLGEVLGVCALEWRFRAVLGGTRFGETVKGGDEERVDSHGGKGLWWRFSTYAFGGVCFHSRGKSIEIGGSSERFLGKS
ncbi:hypothetical protein [Bartonella rattaustraliani]|uniref:hypothetical protein n=1 Tax=Bartonella rattaustraliani TaxID=481139 RepID=UPI00178C195C|nr:hypothetical protein [Bartonella rattaustraliani]